MAVLTCHVCIKCLGSIAQWTERRSTEPEVPGSTPGRIGLSQCMPTGCRHSIVAIIPACHAGDRGSIPRDGVLLGHIPHVTGARSK